MTHAASLSADLLLASLQASILKRPGQIEPFDVAWDRLLELARATKTVGLLQTGLERLRVAVPPDISQRLAAARADILHSGLAQLRETIAVHDVLTREGIRPAFFKGVVRQQQLYGRPDVRPSQDIDLLVPRYAYAQAKAILASSGYTAGVDPRSRWWHHYLGEAPYRPPPASRFVIDLHYRVQQPGAPAPKKQDEFIDSAGDQRFGTRTIKVLAPLPALLISVISYSKALRDCESWLSYAHEIAFAFARLTRSEIHALFDLAARQGLAKLTAEAIVESCELLQVRVPDIDRLAKLPNSRAELIESALAGEIERPLRRSSLRWRWADGGLGARLASVIGQTTFYYASNLARLREESKAP